MYKCGGKTKRRAVGRNSKGWISKRTPAETRKLLAGWDERLARMGLSVDAGRHDWLTYGHMLKDLDFDGRIAIKPTTGERLEE